MEDGRMAGNATRAILHVSNRCALISLGILIIFSFVDVVPWKQEAFDRLCLFIWAVFVISLSITFCTMIVSFFHRKRKNAHRGEGRETVCG